MDKNGVKRSKVKVKSLWRKSPLESSLLYSIITVMIKSEGKSIKEGNEENYVCANTPGLILVTNIISPWSLISAPSTLPKGRHEDRMKP